MNNEYINHLKKLATRGGEIGFAAQAELVKEEERDEHGRWASASEHSNEALNNATKATGASTRGDAKSYHEAAMKAHEAAAEMHADAAENATSIQESIAHEAAAEAHEYAAEAHEELASGMRGASAEDAEVLSEKADNATRRANR